MHVIHKYTLEILTSQSVYMPVRAEILTVQVQHGQICLWAMLPRPNEPISPRKILMYGTGHAIQENGKYIGTIQLEDGALVLHVFEGYSI